MIFMGGCFVLFLGHVLFLFVPLDGAVLRQVYLCKKGCGEQDPSVLRNQEIYCGVLAVDAHGVMEGGGLVRGEKYV